MARSSVSDFRRELPTLVVPDGPTSDAPAIARQQGAAAVAASAVRTNADLNLFGMGVNLAQSAAVSGAKGMIEWQLDRLEGHGDVAKQSQLGLDELGSNDTSVNTAAKLIETNTQLEAQQNDPTGVVPNDPAQDAAITAQLVQIERQKRKLQQGILTREQVLTNISKIVKTFSQAAPGWATDFRKAAANATGISNIDTFGIHKALTTASARELALAAQAKAQAKYVERVAINAGKAPANLTAQDAKDYEQEQQMENEAKRIEFSDTIADQNQAVSDQAGDQLMGVYGVITLAKIGRSFDSVMLAASKSGSGDMMASMEEFNAEALGFNTQLAEMEGEMAQKLKALKAPSLDPDGRKWHISQSKYDSLNKEMKQTFDTYRSYFTDAVKFNEFAGMVSAAKGNVEYMANMLERDHPMVMSLQRIGLADPLFKNWVSLMQGGKAEGEALFSKRFGPGIFKAVNGFMTEDHGKYRWGVRQDDTAKHLKGQGNPAVDGAKDIVTTQVDLISHKMTWQNFMAKPESKRTQAEAIQIWKQLPTLLGVNPEQPGDRTRNVLFMSDDQAQLLLQPLKTGAFQAAYDKLEGVDKVNADNMLAQMIPTLRRNYVTTVTDMVTQMAKNAPGAKVLWDPRQKRFHVVGLAAVDGGNALLGINDSYGKTANTAFTVASVMEQLQEMNPTGEKFTMDQMFKDVVDRLSDTARDSLLRIDTLTNKLDLAQEKKKLHTTELHATTGPHTGPQSDERVAAAQALRAATAEVEMLKIQVKEEEATVEAVRKTIPRWGVSAGNIKTGSESSIALRNRTGAAADPRNEIDMNQQVARDANRTSSGKIGNQPAKDAFPKVTRTVQLQRNAESLKMLQQEVADDPDSAEKAEELAWEVARTDAESEAWDRHRKGRKPVEGVALPAAKNNEDKQAPSPNIAQLQGRTSPVDHPSASEVAKLDKDVISDGLNAVVQEIAGLKDPTYGSHIKALTAQIQNLGFVLIDAFTEADQAKWKNYIDFLNQERAMYQGLRDD